MFVPIITKLPPGILLRTDTITTVGAFAQVKPFGAEYAIAELVGGGGRSSAGGVYTSDNSYVYYGNGGGGAGYSKTQVDVRSLSSLSGSVGGSAQPTILTGYATAYQGGNAYATDPIQSGGWGVGGGAVGGNIQNSTGSNGTKGTMDYWPDPGAPGVGGYAWGQASYGRGATAGGGGDIWSTYPGAQGVAIIKWYS